MSKPAEGQPIPAEELKAFYVRQLEIQIERNELTDLQRQLGARVQGVRADFSRLFADRGLIEAEWQLNLKAGKMEKIEQPAGGPVGIVPGPLAVEPLPPGGAPNEPHDPPPADAA